MNIDINLNAIAAQYLQTLQQQLDVIKLLIGSTVNVAPEQSTVAMGFMNFEPAPEAKLSHDETKEKALNWLNLACFRDVIEATGLFLDECLRAVSIAELVPCNIIYFAY